MATIDVAKWRAAGVPADLIAILVDINRAASRIPARGAPGVGIQSIMNDVAGGGLIITLTDGTDITLNDVRATLSEEGEAVLVAAQASLAQLDQALADLPKGIVDLDIEDGLLIKILADGSRVPGPTLPVGSNLPSVALFIAPVLDLRENAPIGAVVATIATDATTLILGGADAALLAIDGTNVITTGTIGGKESLSLTVTGTRADYRERTVSVTVLVDADEEAPAASGGSLQLADGKVSLIEPNVTAGNPEPILELTALTRNGADILAELDENGDIPDAVKSTLSTYSATWVISNGVGDPVTITRTLEVAAAAITPVSEPTAARLYAGQTPAAIPNIATYLSNANYSSGTAQLQVNGENATTATVLGDGDVVSVLVTGSGNLFRRWTLSTVEHAVRLVSKGAQGWAVDINDLVPGTTNVTIGWDGETTTTTRNAIEAGPVVHIEPTISLDGEVFTVSNPGPWINEASAGDISFAYQWRRGSTNISGATGETYTRVVADAGTTTTCRVTATDLNGSTVYTTTGIANPAPQTFEPYTALPGNYRYQATMANTSTWEVDIGAAHPDRDILVEAGQIGGNGVTVTSATIVAGGQTIPMTPVRAQPSGAATPNTHIALYHAKVPLGTTAEITITTSAQSSFRFIDYRRGVKNVISAQGGAGTTGGQTTAAVALSGATVGHKVLAFHARAGSTTDITWTGATGLYNTNPSGATAPWIAAAEGIIPTGGSLTVQAVTGSTSQSAMIVIAAGE